MRKRQIRLLSIMLSICLVFGSVGTFGGPVFADDMHLIDINSVSSTVTGGAVTITGGSTTITGGSATVTASAVTVTIPEIQGESIKSPYEGKYVKDVTGVVTATIKYEFEYKSKQYIEGFYLQDVEGDGNDNTSDAIFVKNSNTKVAVGDKVKVAGKVIESVKQSNFYAYKDSMPNQLPTTTIDTNIKWGSIEVLSKKNKLPEPSVIGKSGRNVPHDLIASDSFKEYNPSKYAIDFYESLECMLVMIKDAKATSALHNRAIAVVPDKGEVSDNDGDTNAFGGTIIRENDLNTEVIQLNKAFGTEFKKAEYIKSGAIFNEPIVGIMEYEWGAYQIYVKDAKLPSYTNPIYEEDKLNLEVGENKLTIASYNVYNHSAKSHVAKTLGIGKEIVEVLKSPDIIGLVEIQDDNGEKDDKSVDATETYNSLINSIANNGGPVYEWVDISPLDNKDGGAPGGNIRVGYLYNPSRVNLKPGTKGKSDEEVYVKDDGSLSVNPGRIGTNDEAFIATRKSLVAEFVFKGKSVFVVANHFSSKGEDQATFGNEQPFTKSTEPNRVLQAEIVNKFAKNLKLKNPDSEIVLLGDMNDYNYSKPLKALAGDDFVNMIDKLPSNEQFTYNYSGNAQVLDNILVSKNLVERTEVDIVNINSIKPDYPKSFRNSDHDPVVVAIEFVPNEKYVAPAVCLDRTNIVKNSTVEFESATKGSTIYYSIDKELDLSNLDNNKLYSNPIEVDKNTTIYTVAVKGGSKSYVKKYDFTVRDKISLLESKSKKDKTITAEVVVTSDVGVFGSTSVFVEDSTCGSYIHTTYFADNVKKGSKLYIDGVVDDYKGTFQLKNVNYEFIGTIDTPKPIVVEKFSDIGEEHESKLVTIKNVTLKYLKGDKSKNTTFRFISGDKEFTSKLYKYAGKEFDEISDKFIVGKSYDVSGFVSEYDKVYSLKLDSYTAITEKDKDSSTSNESNKSNSKNSSSSSTITIKDEKTPLSSGGIKAQKTKDSIKNKESKEAFKSVIDLLSQKDVSFKDAKELVKEVISTNLSNVLESNDLKDKYKAKKDIERILEKSLNLSGKVDLSKKIEKNNGKSTLKVSKTDIKQALDSALQASYEMKMTVAKLSDGKSYNTDPRVVLEAGSVVDQPLEVVIGKELELKDSKVDVVVNTEDVGFVIPKEVIAKGKDVKVSVKKADNNIKNMIASSNASMKSTGMVLDLNVALEDNSELVNPVVEINVSDLISKGYSSDKLGVYIFDEKKNTFEFVKSELVDGKLVFNAPHFSIYTVMESNVSFDDMNKHWAKGTVEKLAAKNIVKGTKDGRFNPDQDITRAEFISMLVDSLGLKCEIENNFSDVSKDAWYYNQVGIAGKYMLTNGDGNGNFDPNAKISRQDMAVMIARAYKIMTSEELKGEGTPFKDQSSIAPYASEAVKGAKYFGIISGYEDNSFKPSNTASRAEASQMILNMLNN